jgi:hypothetical protein
VNKVIFLDIDGVMNGVASRPDHRRGFVGFLDPINVAALNQIVAATGAVVVVSSTWRLTIPWDEMKAAFREVGCAAQLVDRTPDLDARDRQREIIAWLAAQAVPPARYVVIDDDFLMPDLPGALVRTSKLCGLTANDVPAVLRRLAD